MFKRRLILRTALHEATSTLSVSVARYLVRTGCDTSVVNDAGETAMALAKRVGIPEKEMSSYFGMVFVV
jgi:hypothetical protein